MASRCIGRQTNTKRSTQSQSLVRSIKVPPNGRFLLGFLKEKAVKCLDTSRSSIQRALRSLSRSVFNLSVLIFFFFAGKAFAADCSLMAIQTEANECIASELAIETKKINAIYHELRSRLSEDNAKKLRDIQLAWIKFKDLSCSFKASTVERGSSHSYILNTCLLKLTKKRTSELHTLLTCVEGDLSCPVVRSFPNK